MTTATMETKQRPLVAATARRHPGGDRPAPLCYSADYSAKVSTWVLVVQILGIWWLISGIFDLVYMFIDHTAWGWKLFIGIVSILAGIYILQYPLASAIAIPKILALVLGIWGLIYAWSC